MATIEDVRSALWDAYTEARKNPDFCGKASEGHCEVMYNTIYSAAGKDDFLRPYGLRVYSYALGPSRDHVFMRGPEDKQVTYRVWEAPDFFAKAVEVINGWAEKHRQSGPHDYAGWISE